MPLSGCQCRTCRLYQDLGAISKMLNRPPRPLPPDQLATLQQIVREAWEKAHLSEVEQ